MSKDSDAMDVDPPAQPPSPEPAASSTTPSADTASAETSANGPTPAEKGKGPASGTDADAGPSIVPPSEPPTPVPEKHEEPDAEGQKAQDELLKDVPPPDVTVGHLLGSADEQAVLNKDRAPGAHIEASLLSVPQLQVSLEGPGWASHAHHSSHSHSLQALVDKALSLKGEGNKAFTSKPAKLDVARDDYLRALDCLPAVPKHLPPPGPDDPRIREVSDEEADQIELDFLAGPARIRADNSVRDTQKALWGNLGAVYAKQVD